VEKEKRKFPVPPGKSARAVVRGKGPGAARASQVDWESPERGNRNSSHNMPVQPRKAPGANSAGKPLRESLKYVAGKENSQGGKELRDITRTPPGTDAKPEARVEWSWKRRGKAMT